MNLFFLGAIAALSLVAALFFLRFWHRTRDRLFLAFALSFGVEGVNRIALARLQSILFACPRRSSRAWCNRSHTPARCQSRSRRQHVMPLPQPISCGSSSH